jgi:uncharacterized protein (TIGR03435 family)
VTERRTTITKAATPGNRIQVEDGRFVSEGLELQVVLRHLYDLPKSQFVVELPDAETPYEITIESPGIPRPQIVEYARAVLMHELGIEARQRSEEQDVFVLRRIDGANPLEASTAAKPEHTARGTDLHCVKQPLTLLLGHLSRAAGGKVFVDETGLDGRYDYDLAFYDKDSLVEELRRLGLEYRKDRREVQVTVLVPTAE